jgi:oligo-1,6-glucosidase
MWWQSSVVYQIYPRSFADSNGDGVGDLRGILQKLDYLQELGVDVIWLSPVYQSPNDDNGYDISDYQAINQEFGTMADWDELLAAMHHRGLKLIMDLVVNHTSDEHPWFVESRKYKDNPYRDYYIWRPAKNSREPNNWSSAFGGSAWQLDPATGEYYLHLFSKKQPDLNWENPRVRQEIYQMMRWWLDKGVDGFRMDVINFISKAPGLPDANSPKGERYQFGGRHYVHGPRLSEYLDEMKREVLSNYDVLTVGEMPMVTSAQAAEITDQETGQLSMVFQFEHMDLDNDPAGSSKFDAKRYELADLKRVLTRWQKDLAGRGWNSSYLANHDQPRSVSRFGDDGRYRVESAKLLATLLHLLHGTPYIYQGEEIGMTNVKFESIDDYRDIETLNTYREMIRGQRLAPRTALRKIHAKSRDNARTPMQWDDTPNAGFTTGKPWIGLNRNYVQINVRNALATAGSIFHYYQRLIRLRRDNPVIVYGGYDLLDTDPRIYAFTRTLDDDRLLVLLNFSSEAPIFALPSGLPDGGQELLISNYEVDPGQPIAKLTMRPWEARVYRLAGASA